MSEWPERLCNHHRLTRNCPECAQDRENSARPPVTKDLTTLERDVVTAAEAWMEWGCNAPPMSTAVELCDAIRALQSARKPAGVRPESVPLGTRFRFGDPRAADYEGCTLRRVGIYRTGADTLEPAWLIEEADRINLFHADDLIIPEQD